MRTLKEALVGSREELLGGSWAVVRVAERVRRRGRCRCIVIKSEALGNLEVDTLAGSMMRERGTEVKGKIHGRTYVE